MYSESMKVSKRGFLKALAGLGAGAVAAEALPKTARQSRQFSRLRQFSRSLRCPLLPCLRGYSERVARTSLTPLAGLFRLVKSSALPHTLRIRSAGMYCKV